MAQTDDGGYILGGISNSGISRDKTESSLGYFDYWVVKFNSSGTITWQNTIGGDGDDFLNSIKQTTDGGFILGGTSRSGATGDKTEATIGVESDCWVVKLNSIGEIEWQNTIGGSGVDGINSIQQTTDGGYFVGAISNSVISGDKTEATFGQFDFQPIKLNSSGAIVWQKTIGGNIRDDIKTIKQTSDVNFILGGYSESGISGNKTEANLGSNDYWIVKVDAVGNIVWQNTIGGTASDILYSITANYFSCGYAQ